MKETRAIVIGVLVVVLVAWGISRWRRPAREYHRVRGYRVEIEKREGGSRKSVSFTIPMALIARAASFGPFGDISARMREEWGDGHVTPRDILGAAKDSSAGHPGVITRDHTRIEVTADGAVLDIAIKDEWGKSVRVRIPRSLVESLSQEKRVSGRDVLRRLDELGPGEIVEIHDGDDQVTITAEAR
jgi:hypothetical protein